MSFDSTQTSQNPSELSDASALIQSGYLELFYAALFHPIRTFRFIAAAEQPTNQWLLYALLSVLLISTIAPMIDLIIMGGSPASLVLTIPFHAFLGVSIWILMGLIISFLAYAFTGQTRIRTFLVLSGLATLPWLLIGPVSLLKTGIGITGVVLCTILGLLVWLWSVLLFTMAIALTYTMTAERVLIILVMPLVMGIVFIGWVWGFIRNIVNLWFI